MTPAIKLLENHAIAHTVHSYEHKQNTASYGNEAVSALGLDSTRVFKTLVVELSNGDLAVGVVPVSGQLSMKSIARACGSKKAAMAEPAAVERATAYVLGGVSPLGQKQSLKTVIDESSQNFDSIFVSAGKRGLEIELAPTDLLALTRGDFANIVA
jgi:Cys-tRNA(Pro)/Cys-tRNA(Cys) deacylase